MGDEKMEIDIKPVPVKVETAEAPEQKVDTSIRMETVEEQSHERDQKPEIVEDVKNVQMLEEPPIIEIVPKEAGLAYLKTEGEEVNDIEENLTLTAEEVRKYIEKAVMFQIEKNSPLAESVSRAKAVEAELKERRDEFQKLAKLIDLIERDQLRYLCGDKTLRRYLTKTGGVGVDLPVLPNALNAAANDALMRKGFSPQATHFSKPASAATRTITPTSAVNARVALKANSNTIKDEKPTLKAEADIECIDLTDESEAPKPKPNPFPIKGMTTYPALVKHPAPLPPKPFSASDKSWLPVPPKPRLKVSSEERGIVLQWDMIPNTANNYAKLSTFDIFGYQEQKHLPINTLLWKKIGTVTSMTLPMACTLTQFSDGNKYHFAIRAVDVHNRCGPYSEPISVVYKQHKK